MHNPVEIVLRGIAHSAALERYIADEADRLERQCGRIRNCYVVVEALDRQRQQGAQFAVRLNITLPGTEVVVNREHGKDVYVALRDAFKAAGLQLKDRVCCPGSGKPRSRDGTPDARS